MQIAEVPIEPKALKKKKYSAKTKKAAEEFLSEIDLSIKHLDDNQKVHILKHFKTKRMIKWYVPFMIVMFFVNLGFVFGYKHILNIITDFIYVSDTMVEVIEDDGSTSFREVTKSQLEMHRNYGLVSAMIGSSATVVFFSAITCLTGCIGWLLKTRNDEKIFKAFLPAIKNSSPTINPKFATHNS